MKDETRSPAAPLSYSLSLDQGRLGFRKFPNELVDTVLFSITALMGTRTQRAHNRTSTSA